MNKVKKKIPSHSEMVLKGIKDRMVFTKPILKFLDEKIEKLDKSLDIYERLVDGILEHKEEIDRDND